VKASLDEKGRLVPPVGRRAGEERLQALRAEIARIGTQLGDPARTRSMSPADAQRWRVAAECARRHLLREERQLTEWLRDPPDTALLRRAADVLADLRSDDYLEPDERDLLDEISAHLAKIDGAV
jgi:hypothetical protein